MVCGLRRYAISQRLPERMRYRRPDMPRHSKAAPIGKGAALFVWSQRMLQIEQSVMPANVRQRQQVGVLAMDEVAVNHRCHVAA